METETPRKKTSTSQWCSAIACTNSRYKNPGLAFFRFPRDEPRCRRWVTNSRREDLLRKSSKELYDSNVLCALHFEDSQFTNCKIKNRLRPLKAVPTIFDAPNARPEIPPSPPKGGCSSHEPNALGHPPPEQLPHGSPQSRHIPAGTSNALRIDKVKMRSLKKRIEAQRKTLKRLRPKSKDLPIEQAQREIEYLKTTSERYLTPEVHRFVSTQLDMSTVKGKSWRADYESHALSLYRSSPRAYTLFQHQFQLPSVDTLKKRVMSNMEIHSVGFPQCIMDAFRNSVCNMGENDKECLLIFDEIRLKSSLRYSVEKDLVEGFEDFGFLGRSEKEADHATVFLARGLFSEWTQPFGYFLSHSTTRPTMLKTLMFTALNTLKSIGLTVKGVVCDQGVNHQAVFRALNVTEQCPMFSHNGDTILVFFDPSHLLKSVRNDLSKYDFYVGQDVVSWTVIKDFYERDKHFPLRLAPKLKDHHVDLIAFPHRRVNLAPKVLSYAVARGISCMCECNVLPSSHRATAMFIERFDRLFSVFKSHGGSGDANSPCKHPVSSPSSPHISFLNETLEWLNELKYGPPDRPESAHNMPMAMSRPCIGGWMQTIRALLILVDDVRNTEGNKLIRTNHLNQDCLKTLFATVRNKAGVRHGKNPDPQDFRLAMQRIMVDGIFLSSRKASCDTDVAAFILNLSTQPRESLVALPRQTPTSCEDNVHLPSLINVVKSANLEDFVLPENGTDTVRIIGGCILKAIQGVVCHQCIDLLEEQGSLDHSHLSEHSDGQSGEEGRKKPSLKLAKAIAFFESAFQAHCSQSLRRQGLLRYFVMKLNALQCTLYLKSPSCQCNTPQYVSSLFLVIRVYQELAMRNDTSRQRCLRKNRKRDDKLENRN